MLSSYLWLSPAAQEVLSATSKLLQGAAPCAATKLTAALREAGDGTCSGLLADRALCTQLAKEIEGSGMKEISDKTAADVVGALGKVLEQQFATVKKQAGELEKKLPKNGGLPCYGDILKVLPSGKEPAEALRRDWLLWNSIGCSHNPKELSPPAAKIAAQRISIAACAGSGPSAESVLSLHILDHLAEYQAWEASLGANHTKAKSVGLLTPFDEKTTKEVSLRRVLAHVVPQAVANEVASKVMNGEKAEKVLASLADAAKARAVMPMYAQEPAPKEPKGKKEGGAKSDKGQVAADAAPSKPAAGEFGALYKSTATQELQWHLLAYRLRPRTSLTNVASATTPVGTADTSDKKVVGGDVPTAEKPKGFASIWAPAGGTVPPGHTSYSWQKDKLLGKGFPCTWVPDVCPPGHTPYSWSGTGGAPTPSLSTKAPPKGQASATAPAAAKAAAKAPAAPKAPAAKAAAASGPAEGSNEAALAKIDIRCGRILECRRVPDADSLYLLKINVGEEQPRQVVSSLVKFYKEDELKDRQVMVYCNIKPGKMRGFESQAMVLAATRNKGADDESCELLAPPQGAKEGDRPVVGDLEVGSASEGVSVKNISKVWGQVQPLLKTNDKVEATFEGKTMTMKEGPVTATSLTGVGIY